MPVFYNKMVVLSSEIAVIVKNILQLENKGAKTRDKAGNAHERDELHVEITKVFFWERVLARC